MTRWSRPGSGSAARLWPLPDGSVWAVWQGDAGCAATRIDSIGRMTRFDLPDMADVGVLTAAVAATGDGAVWVTNGYTISRLAPRATTFTSITVPVNVETQLPGPADVSAPLAGSWLASCAPLDASHLLVSRINVPYLTVVGPDLRTRRGNAIPGAFAGARTMMQDTTGTLWLAAGWLGDAATSLVKVSGTPQPSL